MLSPHIDALAASGVLFERAYCNVPVCGASRASLLTGIRPTPTRFTNFNTRADQDTPQATPLSQLFKDAGYTALSNGKIFHHPPDFAASWSRPPWRAGHDNRTLQRYAGRGYVSAANRAILAEVEKAEAAAAAAKRAKDGGSGKGARPGPRRGSPKGGIAGAWEIGAVPDNHYPDGMLADKTIADLERLATDARAGRPFFLACGFQKPHLPFNAPRPYWERYPRAEIDLADTPFAPKGAPRQALHNWNELRAYHGIPGTGPLDDETARTLIHGYYACVSYVDAQIGRVLAALDRLGQRENTIVILWGDHGWNLGEHGLWCKHCNFETSLHAPLLISGPGIPAGQRSRALVEFVDIYPSLAALCGLTPPAGLEGDSFVPLLSEPDRPWKKAVFSRYGLGDSVKTDRYRYTAFAARRGLPAAEMLYDHQADPMENRNIATDPAHAAALAEMRAIREAGWRTTRPTVPTPA